MKKSKFSESQIVGILKEVELSAKVGETCRKHGISEPTYNKWKTQYSGITVSHLSPLRELQNENAKIKPVLGYLRIVRPDLISFAAVPWRRAFHWIDWRQLHFCAH